MDENAADWVRWARSPELDHAFWHLNLPTLINLLPIPRGLTLDVGCGEGRVARALKECGYRMVGVESSRGLVAAAQEADPSFDVHLADAAQMTFPDDHFDLAVASLSLMNMDEMPQVVSEIARVLRPMGRFCFSILHSINSWRDAGEVSYFHTVRYNEELTRGDARLTLNDTHRPLSDYFRALEDAVFLRSESWSLCPTMRISQQCPELSDGANAQPFFTSVLFSNNPPRTTPARAVPGT